MEQHLTVEERNFAFENRLQTFSIVNHGYRDLRDFFGAAFTLFEQNVTPVIDTYFLVKISACFAAKFEKAVGDQIETQTLYLWSPNEIVDFETELRSFYDDEIVTAINQRIDDVGIRGSGFSLSEILELNIQISSFDPLSGSSYIPVPKFLQLKRAVINVINNDNECFKYAVLSAICCDPKLKSDKISHPERASSYKQFENMCDFSGLKYPVNLKQISSFEKKNPNISVNVYMFENKTNKVRPLRLTSKVKKSHIHLLLLTKQVGDSKTEVKSHYCWIKKLSALVGSQLSKDGHKRHFCDRCLNSFTTEEKLSNHLVYCSNQNECQIEMPSFNINIVEFKNFKNQLRAPFIVYADIESILKPTNSQISKSDSTTAYQHHEAHSVGFYFKCWHDDAKSYYNYVS